MRFGLFGGAPGLAGRRRAYAFEAESLALFARFTTPPTELRKRQYDQLIRRLKRAGVWSKLDALYILAAADAQAAQRNLKQDAFNLTPTNSPTFTADRGYQGDGVSAHLLTDFNPATAGGVLTLNSNHLSIWNRTEGALNVTDMGVSASGSQLRIDSRSQLETARMFGADATVMHAANTIAVGFTIGIRDSAASRRIRKNTTTIGSDTVAATVLPSQVISICVLNGGVNYSARQYAAASIGAALTDAESDSLYLALNQYLSAVGAA